MAQAGVGVPGAAVVLVATGGVFVYAGLSDRTPLEALKQITSGRPAPVASKVAAVSGPSVSGPGGAAAGAVSAATGGNALVAATAAYTGDRYSQPRRWEPGFSDCSSFVGKAFKAVGITPPGFSTTWEYLAWPKLYAIRPGQEAAGDLVVTTGHMIMVTGPGQGIGQQNSRDNVQTGPISALIGGSLNYLRYPWGR